MKRTFLFATIFATLSGCSLFGNYDVDGLPCDPNARRGDECIPDAGYVCVRPDGGTDGGAGICTRAR